MADHFRFGNNENVAEDDEVGSQDNYIIQCPSCHARFVLPEEELAGIDDPRFHCPRCDSLFDAVDANLKEVRYRDPSAKEEGVEDEADTEDNDTAEAEIDYQSLYDDQNYYNDNYDNEINQEDVDERHSLDYDAYEDSRNARYYSDDEVKNVSPNNENVVSSDDNFDPFADLDDPEDKFEYKPLSQIKYNQDYNDQNYNPNQQTYDQISSTADSGKRTIRDFFKSKQSSDNSTGFILEEESTNSNDDYSSMSGTFNVISPYAEEEPEPKKKGASSWLTSWKKKSDNKTSINDTKNTSTESDSFYYSSPVNTKKAEEKKEKKNNIDPDQYSFSFDDTKANNSKSANSYSVNTSDFEIQLNEEKQNFSERLYREPAPIRTSLRQDMQSERKVTPPFYVYILVPFAVVLLALGVVTYKLVNTDQQNLIRAFLPSAPTAAPSDLIITDLDLKQSPLQSGEIVHVISGNISNHTSQSFSNILLEGLAFNAAGQPIYSMRVNAGSTLAGADVKSFTPEMIRDKQDQIPLRRYELAPNASQKFEIGIVADEMRNAKFYSARIYTAE